MSGEIPYIDPRGRYTIGMAAALLGISTQTLRRHVEARFIDCRWNPRNNRKVFIGKDLIQYRDATI